VDKDDLLFPSFCRKPMVQNAFQNTKLLTFQLWVQLGTDLDEFKGSASALSLESSLGNAKGLMACSESPTQKFVKKKGILDNEL